MDAAASGADAAADDDNDDDEEDDDDDDDDDDAAADGNDDEGFVAGTNRGEMAPVSRFCSKSGVDTRSADATVCAA